MRRPPPTFNTPMKGKKKRRRNREEKPEITFNSINELGIFADLEKARKEALLANKPDEEEINRAIQPSQSFIEEMASVKETNPKKVHDEMVPISVAFKVNQRLGANEIHSMRTDLLKGRKKNNNTYQKKLSGALGEIRRKLDTKKDIEEQIEEVQEEIIEETISDEPVIEEEQQVLDIMVEPITEEEADITDEIPELLELEEVQPFLETEPTVEIEEFKEAIKQPKKRRSLFSRFFGFLFNKKKAKSKSELKVEATPEPKLELEPVVEPTSEPELELEPVVEPKPDPKPVPFELERASHPSHLAKSRMQLKGTSDPILMATSQLVESGMKEVKAKELLQITASPWGLLHALNKEMITQFWKLATNSSQQMNDEHLNLLSRLSNEKQGNLIPKNMIETLFRKLPSEKFTESEIVEIWDNLQVNTLKKQCSIMFGHLFSRLGTIDWNWKKDSGISVEMNEILDKNLSRLKLFDEENILLALKLICAIAIETPSKLKQFNIRKKIGGNKFEDKVEAWVSTNYPEAKFITEKQIKKKHNDIYGGLRLSWKVTPDILFESPLKMSNSGEELRWIDAKNHFLDPAFSPDDEFANIANQMKKYVSNYGKGMIIWANPHSEEWNATEPTVFHHTL